MDTERKYQEIYTQIRDKLREIEHDWGARNQLASKAGVGPNLIYQILHKPHYQPSFRTIYKLLYALLDRCPLSLNECQGSADKYHELLNKLKNITEVE